MEAVLIDLFTKYLFQTITVILTAYSIMRQQQMSKRMRAAQDAAKGLEIPTEAEVKAIPVVYGRAMVGGIRVFHKTSSNYKHANGSGPYFKEFVSGLPGRLAVSHQECGWGVDELGNSIETCWTVEDIPAIAPTGLIENRYGSKNEFLFVNQVISLGEIEDVVDVIIDPDRFYRDTAFDDGQRINIYKKGGTADLMLAENFPERANAKFQEMAYAAMCFKINRDNPQYQSGTPQIQFLVKGRKLKSIVNVSNTYSLSASETYSNNPARVLLDYLTSSLYGLGISIDEIDLESFYKVQQVCDTIVETNVPSYGRIWTPTSSNLYPHPADTVDKWHSFLRENGVWERENADQYFPGLARNTFERSDRLNNALNFYIPEDANYTFNAAVDDDIVVKVDGVLIWDGQNIAPVPTWNPEYPLASKNVYLTKGIHKLEIIAYNSRGECAVALTIDDTTLEKNNIFNLKDPALVTTRSIPLYECNLIIDPEKPIRDNIETILETMNGAELVWSSGKYKLICQYPSNEENIEIADVLTDNNIIRDSFAIKWPNASEKLNYCTVKFTNEALNFKEDSVSWPDKNSTEIVAGTGKNLYNYYLDEDNGVALEADFFEAGIKDYHHAIAKAEERVRRSRSSLVYSFKTSFKGLLYEAGDVIELNSAVYNIVKEYIQVQEVKLDSDMTVAITGVRFDINTLAWNLKDNEIPPKKSIGNERKFQVPYGIVLDKTKLTWSDADPTFAISYKIYNWHGGPRKVNGISYLTEFDFDPTFTIKATEITRVFYGITNGIYETNRNIAILSENGSLSISSLLDSYLADVNVNSDFVNNTPEQWIRNCYLRFLKREPETEGFNYWLSQVANGLTAKSLIEFMVNEAYQSGMYFSEIGQSNLKEFTLNIPDGIYAFSIRGIDMQGKLTKFSLPTRLYLGNFPYLPRSISLNASTTNFYTPAGGIPTPEIITLTAIADNFISPNYEWYIDGINQNNSTDTLALSSFPSGNAKVISVTITDTIDSFVLSQTLSIPSIADGMEYDVEIESTNGDTFRIGKATTTTLIAHVSLNGVEITNEVDATKFKWERNSLSPELELSDLAWNAAHDSGFKQVTINVDDVASKATFFCRIRS